ncbi:MULTISPECIES: hypothetical protein [Pseudomonas]|nr:MULTISPECIES: hypothetical protein [Pseudomonas]WPN20801.1 hypothetical protein QMK57_15350 [Pseudomonas marginalis]
MTLLGQYARRRCGNIVSRDIGQTTFTQAGEHSGTGQHPGFLSERFW